MHPVSSHEYLGDGKRKNINSRTIKTTVPRKSRDSLSDAVVLPAALFGRSFSGPVFFCRLCVVIARLKRPLCAIDCVLRQCVCVCVCVCLPFRRR